MIGTSVMKIEEGEAEVGAERTQQKMRVSLKFGLLLEALREEVSLGKLGSHMPGKQRT
jgi:hypothetical protein